MSFLHILYHEWRHKVWMNRARLYVGKNGYSWRRLPEFIDTKLEKHRWAMDRLRGCTLMGLVDKKVGRTRCR